MRNQNGGWALYTSARGEDAGDSARSLALHCLFSEDMTAIGEMDGRQGNVVQVGATKWPRRSTLCCTRTRPEQRITHRVRTDEDELDEYVCELGVDIYEFM